MVHSRIMETSLANLGWSTLWRGAIFMQNARERNSGGF